KRSDIYSFGVIMSELASGRPPFELLKSNRRLLLNLIVNGDRDSPIISGAPVLFTQLYQHCWDADPSKRPTIEDAVKSLANVHPEESKIHSRPPTEIKFQEEPHSRLRRYIRTGKPSSSVPAISPRVDSIGWMDSTNEFSEYDVIEKDDLKGYARYSGKSTSMPSIKDASPSSKRREKARSLSFVTFRKSSQRPRSYENGLHHSVSLSEGSSSSKSDNEYPDMGAGSLLQDGNQPKIILIARYCPVKSIIKVLEQLKRQGADLTPRETYKSKSVFHNLIWNDHLFDAVRLNHSQRKLAKHESFRVVLKWLISNNLNINAADDFGWTTLHEAIWKRREPGVILALLENQANPNIPDKFGATPLHQCFDLLRKTTRDDENQHIFIIMRILLQHGADPNMKLPDTTLTISGSSLPNCLFAAVYMDLPLDIIELMIKRGADITSATFQGLRLIDFAAKINNTVAL
ncbi:2729_t:CDS:2, partial [Acaulospora colombiana]